MRRKLSRLNLAGGKKRVVGHIVSLLRERGSE